MTDIKQWIKGIESLEPPETWEPRSTFVSAPANDRVRRVGTILVAAAIAVSAITFAVVALRPTRSLPPTSTSERAPAWLRVLAHQQAANNGDAEPDTILWGLVSIAQADPLVGLTPEPQDARAREFLVVLTGHFICHSCKVPEGARLPRGDAIVFTVNPGTRSVSDFSVLGEVPSVANLHLRPLRAGSLFSSADAPWTFPQPDGWTTSTVRSAANPDFKAGVLITYVTNTSYRFDFRSPGPNSGAGASEAIGRGAVVIEVEFLWSPPDENPTWSSSVAPTSIRAPSAWHDDAQNPGWASRERRVCRGQTCVWVLEWHGPDASTEAIGVAQNVVESIELKTTWAGGTPTLSPAKVDVGS
jgi:hypothetical protein